MKPQRFFSALVVVVLAMVGLSCGVARAYPIGSTSPAPSVVTLGTSFQTLVAPFAAFFESLSGSIGSQSVLGGSPASPPPTPSFNFNNIQNVNPHIVLDQVDRWFMQNSFSQIVTFVLSAIVWVLWLTQQFVQWLLGLIH